MPISLRCPQCQSSVAVADRITSQAITCGRCGGSIPVRVPAAPPASAPARPALPVQDIVPLLTEAESCDFCHTAGPTTHAVFHQHIGLVFWMLHRSVKGHMCWACVQSIYSKCQWTTALAGWWGLISFFATPIFLILNRVRAMSAWSELRNRQTASPGPHPQFAARPGAVAAPASPPGSKLVAPAVGLILTAAAGLLVAGFGLLVFATETPEKAWAREVRSRLDKIARTKPPALPPQPLNEEPTAADLEQMRQQTRNWTIFWSVQCATPLLILAAAVQMIRLKTYAVCLVGTIVAVLPLTNPCCLLTMPFGLWAFVILCLHDVRRAFG